MDPKHSTFSETVLLKNLSEIEEIAEEILADKEQIKNLDQRRNTNREALTALRKCKDEPSSKKSWMCLGGMFIKYPTDSISDMLLKDQKELETEIKNVRDDLKAKVSKLHQLEGNQLPKGFDLTALDKEELSKFTAFQQ
ncbi:p53 and DNA damage-regulated protein 1-like [Dendronephthya gigantea]|uniref:p53 and DNA damage-regulated protein 1-like n=1 Tax=Dendronephthya gigantea TaxID=151771 RepID=UPI00106D5054|nr:p53 and DNA damage-regulated protein 1-like [Dendronephthya gigantea]